MKLTVLFLLLFSVSAWSRVHLELVLNTPSVKQGEIAVGKLIVRESQGQTSFAGLKGKNVGKTVYLLNVSPFMGKAGQLESDAKVIFLKVPETTSVSEVLDGEEIAITWKGIEVVPIEETKSFLLGDFEVPERKDVLPWVLGFFIVLVLGAFGYWISHKFKLKKNAKFQLKKMKQEILACQNYDDIVLMWRQKRTYLQTFPQLENAFKNFEQTLFKYQFKPQRTEKELDEVQKAYEKFKSESTGALNGI